MTTSTARAPHSAAVIGCGRGGDGSAGAHSIGYAHAKAYAANPHVRLLGACDLDETNLRAFATRFSVPDAHRDLATLLASARPEVVSVCTYAGSHRAIVEACVAAGVRAIWCEKPLALTMDDAEAMVTACEKAGVKMIVNFCRRPLHLFQEVRQMLRAGLIGRPMMILGAIDGWDQAEWGSHWHDMIRAFMEDQPVQWVMGQARCTGAKRGYGHVMEEHSVAYYAFADGTRALLDGGVGLSTGTALRVIGAEGFIDLAWDGKVVLCNKGGLREVPVRSSLHSPTHADEVDNWLVVLADLLAWMHGGTEPEVSARNALRSTELYLAAWESAKRGDRVDLPLTGQSVPPLDAVAARQGGAGARS